MSNQITNHEEVLNVVATGNGVTVRDVAFELYVSQSAARRYLNELVERGWVVRSRLGRSGTSLLFYSTERGREAHANHESW